MKLYKYLFGGSPLSFGEGICPALAGMGVRTLAIICLTLLTLTTTAQHITPTVLPTQGGTLQSAAGVISYSVGQPFGNTLKAGSNIISVGFEQPEVGAPATPAPQGICSDTAYTFTFYDTTGVAANKIEWALNKNFDSSHLISSPGMFTVVVTPRSTDTIWLRSVDSITLLKSSSIYTYASLAKPDSAIPYLQKDTVCQGNFAVVLIPNSQPGVRYDVVADTGVVNNDYGNADTLIIFTSNLDTTATFYVMATDTLTGCSIRLAPDLTVYIAPVAGLPVFTSGDTLLSADSTSCYLATSTNALSIRYYIYTGGATINQLTGCITNIKSPFTVMAIATGQFGCSITSSILPVSVTGLREDGSSNHYNTSGNWTPLGPMCCTSEYSYDVNHNSAGGRVYSFAFAENPTAVSLACSTCTIPIEYYAGTPYGGLWKSDDNGQTWLDWNSGLQGETSADPLCSVADIAIDPTTETASPTIYIATGHPWTDIGQYPDAPQASTGVFKSTDGGATFQPTGLQFNYDDKKYVTKLAINTNNNNQLFAATSDGLRMTLNGGTTWPYMVLPNQNIYQGDGCADADYAVGNQTLYTVEISSGTNYVYASSSDIYYSDNQSTGTITSIRFKSFTQDMVSQHGPGATFPLDLKSLYLSQILVKVAPLTSLSGTMDYIFANVLYLECNPNYGYLYKTKTYVWDPVSFKWISVTTDLENPVTDCKGSENGVVEADRAKMAVRYNSGNGNFELWIGNCSTSQLIYDPGSHTLTTTAVNYGYSGEGHADNHAFEFIPGTDQLLNGNDGGIWQIDGSSGAVTERNNGLNLHFITGMGCARTNPNRIIVGSFDQGASNLNENGWFDVGCADGQSVEAYDYSNAEYYFYSTGDNGQPIIYYDDQSGSSDCSGTGINSCELWYTNGAPMIQDPDNKDIFYYGCTELSAITRSGTNTFSSTELLELDHDGQFCPTCFDPADISSFVVTPKIGSNKYFYLATLGYYTGCESYLFCNRTFNSSSPTFACGVQPFTSNYLGAWSQICLPTNSTCSGTTFDAANSFSLNGITVSDEDPNTIWICFTHALPAGFYDGSTHNGTLHQVMKGVYSGGSWTWTDDQMGLPSDVQCNSIIYEKGSNDGLYLGTTRGVYYKNANLGCGTSGSWVPFQTNLPYVEINSLDINYCSKQIRAGTNGRGVWTTPLYTDECNSAQRLVNSNETWVGNIDIGEDIIIQTGNVLSIEASTAGVRSTVNMCQGCKIIVQPGAKLSVNNSNLTNVCNLPWEGIVIQGNSTLPQDLSTTNPATAISNNQGFVYLNDDTVSNAHEAMRVWDYTTGDNTKGTGGIGIVSGTSFIDNRRDAEFTLYQDNSSGSVAPNLSSFTNCTFTTDPGYSITDDPFDAFVTMWGTYGVKFTGCTFTRNNAGSTGYITTDANGLGQGIRSIDAEYSVDGCTFNGLEYGVLVENGDDNASVNIQNNIFTDNYTGVDITNSNYTHVGCNTFALGHINNVAPTYTNSQPDYPVGVVFDNSSQFKMEQNIFNTSSIFGINVVDADLQGAPWAIIGSGFINTSVDGLYSNTCNDNDYNFTDNTGGYFFGNVANGQNSGYGTANHFLDGLMFLCNNNINYTDAFGIDFYVGEANFVTAPANYGIGLLQIGNNGFNYAAAANTFSAASTTFPNQFVNTESAIYYGANSDAGNTAPTAYSLANAVIPLTMAQDGGCLTNWGPGNCLIHLSPTQATAETAAIPAEYAAYSSASATLTSLIDGGNTGALKLLVINADTANADSVITVLDSLAPNLSATVLKQVVVRTDVFTDTAIYLLMYHNPDALSDNQLFDTLSNRFTGRFLDTLVAVKADTTHRTNVQYAVAQHARNLDSLSRDVIIAMKLDTGSSYSHSTYRAVLANLNDKAADYMQVHDYLAQQYSDSALILLDSLPARYAIDTLADSSYITFKAYTQFKKALLDDSLSIGNLDSAHVLILNDIAVNGIGPAARKAKAILHFFYGYAYKTQLGLQLPDGVPRMLTVNNSNNIVTDSIKQLSPDVMQIVPNPATGDFLITVYLNGDNNQQVCKLRIFSMQGEPVYQTSLPGGSSQLHLNANTMHAGIYAVIVTDDNGNTRLKNKLVIIK